MLLSVLFLCQADCLVVNYNQQWVESMGSVEATSKRSKLEAFQLVKRDCQKRVNKKAGEKAVLAKDISYYKRTVSSGSSSGSRAAAGDWQLLRGSHQERFYFSRANASSWSSQYYSENEFRLDLEFARVLDREVCDSLKENRKAIPTYTGDEEPLG